MKKTILITGSTDGIGKLAALKLANKGHRLILHGRNASKLENVVNEIKSESGSIEVFSYVADFADLKAVRTMAQDIKNTGEKIDVLINNAGVFLANNPQDEKGQDVRFVVNLLAPVLLTDELIGNLNGTEVPRVINLSSAAQSTVSLPALLGKETLSDQVAYAQSKLALTMWNNYKAKQNDKIVFIAVNPGSLLNTKMVQEAYGQHWSPADKGADILVDLATNELHSTKTGRYFDNDKGDYGPAHSDATDDAKITSLVQTMTTMIQEVK